VKLNGRTQDQMKQQLSKREFVLIAGALTLGVFLRTAELGQLAVEHFDEGVYSSTVWYQDLNDAAYPARHLYAPPALPTLIGAFAAVAGPEMSPFLPGILMGGLTVLLVWGFTRASFGMVAGLLVVFVAALSDFHILYSRMALTDAPTLMWIVLAVWLGVVGIDRQSRKTMLFAGLACGCAWWTKYTGWLPIAIISSGSLFWWVLGGRRTLGLGRLLTLNAIMAVTAVVVWAPWLWSLQDVGGYEAVAANHNAYRNGWTSWQENLATHITWYSFTDSWLSALAIAIGITFAGSYRWFEARRSTWNQTSAPGTGITPGLLTRFIGAAVVLSIATLTIGSFGVLAALAFCGLTGIFLWPVLSVLKDESEDAIAGRHLQPGTVARFDKRDHQASPRVDPQLAACVVLAWLCGLLLNIPTYTPYPRLLLPLLAVMWIASAAGIGWWVEACISIGRRSATSGEESRLSAMQVLVAGLVLASVCLGVWTLGGSDIRRSTIHDSRLGLHDASLEVASMCRKAAGIEQSADLKSTADARFVVYVFGEPSVLYHLNQDGISGGPVQDLMFPAATFHGNALPTFMVFGPNALRTPGFMYDWVDIEPRFEQVGDVSYEASDIVLYNLFSPQWLLQHHGEERAQRLEVYRLK
jgi:dolichyl-phosphate-mannose-protein mannosyltransferase